MKKSAVFAIPALLLVFCLLTAGCLSFPFPLIGSKSTGSSSKESTGPSPTPTSVPTKESTKVPVKVPTTVKPATTRIPCKNCISGLGNGGIFGF